MHISKLALVLGASLHLAAVAVPAIAHPLAITDAQGAAGLGRDQAALSSDRQAPTLLANNVQMPEFERCAGRGGRNTVLVRIDADGRVTSAEVSSSSGLPRLDRAAVEGLKLSRFAPEKVAGRPRSGAYYVDVEFPADAE